MKHRKIIFAVIISVAGLVLLNFFILRPPKPYNLDLYQREFVKAGGFLTEDSNGTSAISRYAEAIRIIHSSNAGRIDFNQLPEEYDIGRDVNTADLDRICGLVIEGAKKKNLGLFSYNDFPMSIDVPDYGSFKPGEFFLVQKVVEQASKSNLYIKEDFAKTLALTRANIAMGVQFSKSDIKMVRVTGLSGKEKGLRMLKFYSKNSPEDFGVQKSINIIENELNAEMEQVQKMKNPEPSFWDYLWNEIYYTIYNMIH